MEINNIIFPSTIEKIGTEAFANCDKLTKVIFEFDISGTLDIATDAFGTAAASSTHLTTIDIDATSNSAYE